MSCPAPLCRPFETSPIAALAFTFKRSSDSQTVIGYTATAETTHGLLRVDEDRLVIQWRVSRSTTRMGRGYETSEETEPVSEITVPLAGLASAELRRGWSLLGRGRPKLVLVASDLRAFEGMTGPTGLSMKHPSRIEFTLARHDFDAGVEFAGELQLAISDMQLRRAEARLPDPADPARGTPPDAGSGRTVPPRDPGPS